MSLTEEQKADIKCPKCKTYRYPSDFLNDKNRTLKTCKRCRAIDKKYREKNKCKHGKQKAQCRDEECGGGGSYCKKHGIRKAHCRDEECGGGNAYCKHNIQKARCRDKECGGGNAYCKHNIQKVRCRDEECGGGGAFCKKHGIQKAFCRDKECGGGGAFCKKHGIQKTRCRDKECGGGGVYCKHNIEKQTCRECDIIGYIANTIRSRIRISLKGGKELHTVEYLCCTIAEFKAHIEKQFKEGMSWDNHGEWHIDHIIPIKYENPSLEESIKRLHW